MNLKLEIRRSAYYIYNYEKGYCDALERSLSVYDYIARKYTHFGYIYDEANNILKLPRGLDLQYIIDKCSVNNIFIKDIVDKTGEYILSRRCNIECTGTPRDKYQFETINFLVAKECSDLLKSHRLVSLDVGRGKTFCAIKSIAQLDMPAVVTSVNLSDQWVNRILSFTNCKLNENVIHIKSWEDIDKLNNEKTPTYAAFYVIGIDAMVAGLKRDPDILQKFYSKYGIGIQVFDEVHEHFLKILHILVNISVERVILLSATPKRSDKYQDMLYRKIFRDNIPSYGEDTHNLKKYNIISIRYCTKPNFIDKLRIQTRRGVHSVNYCNYLVRNEYRLKIVMDITIALIRRMYKIIDYDKNRKIIIYIQSLKAISIMKNILENTRLFDNDFKISIGDYSGNKNKDVKHLELNHNIIFTTQHNRAGLDIKGLVMMINWIPISSEGMLHQLRGRLRDEDAYYVDLVDEAFDGMLRQYDKRIKNHKDKARIISYYRYDKGKLNKIERK